MSHEIRTPMNGILGLTELTLQDATDPEQRRNLAMVQSSSRALLAMVNDILDLSKVEALESVPFDLREQLRGAVDLVSPAAREKGLALVLDVDEALADRRQGDPYRLRQVLLNLLSNAVKFTERGSARVSVRPDTGISSPPEHLPAIFESFQQADGSINSLV